MPGRLRALRENGYSVLSSQLDGAPFYQRQGVGQRFVLVIGNEEREELTRRLFALLSEFEAKVLTLFLDGLSYEEMSETLHKPVKSVDNAIQRIKRKSAAIKPQ